MAEFLDKDGLSYFWGKIKSALPSKTSDLTNDGSDGTSTYLESDETAYRSSGIPYGQVDSTSTSTAYTATVPGITSLYDGVCMWLKNGVVNSAANFTINVNNLGAKPVYQNVSAATAESTIFQSAYTFMFIYDSTRVNGGCWVLNRGYNSDQLGIYIRTNKQTMPVSGACGRYRLLFTSADGTKYVPATTSTSTNATTSRDVNQTKINPFGRIFWYASTTILNADEYPAVGVLYEQYYSNLGYSFAKGSALAMTAYKPVYLKCAPQTDGSAIIDSTTPWVQDLPSTEDGKIYIFLGIAYEATGLELQLDHPIYYYKSGCIRPWTNQIIPTVNNATLTIQKNGTTVNTFTANASSNVTANITVPTKTSELTNNSGFLTLTNGELQLTDTNVRLKDTTVARVFSVEPTSGGAVQLHYSAAGNHGLYSKGYGNSLTDSSTFTEDAMWIIYRNSSGYVMVPRWANTGNFLTPISFNEYGTPSVSKGQTIPYIVGTGTTAGTWTGTLTGLTAYYDGLLILYKIPIAGSSNGVTLNINNLGAKTVYFSSTSKVTTHWPVNQPILLVYSESQNSGCWEAIDVYNSDTRPQAQCNTAAATDAKTADMTYFTATNKSYLMVNIRYANTSKSKLTLNINSTGAKDIYINGVVSSSTNYTLPAGSYLVYYSDSKYYFRTDGKITGDITGNAATVGGYTVAANVPSDAVFTDEKVKITNDTTSSNLRVLLGTSQNNSTVTEGIKKSTALNFNPSTGVLYTPRMVIRSSDGNAPFIVDTEDRSTIPSNGDDIGIFNGAYKKTVSGTTTTQYNSIISLIGNNDTQNVNVVRFGSSSGATIITGGAGAKAFPKNFVNTDSSTGKYNSDGAIWLAAQSQVHIYTNASNSAAKFGGHIWMDQGGLRVDRTDAAAGTLNNAYLIIGNNTVKSNAGAAKGTIQIWDRNSSGTAYSAKISPDTLTQERIITIPDESGIIQLQSQWELHGIIECDGVNMEYETTLPDGVTGICMYTTDYVAASSFTDPLVILGTFSDSTEIHILRDVTSCFVVTDISHDGLWINQISTDNTWRPGITSLEGASTVIRTPVLNKNSLKKIKIRTVFHLNPPPEGLNVAILIRRLA